MDDRYGGAERTYASKNGYNYTTEDRDAPVRKDYVDMSGGGRDYSPDAVLNQTHDAAEGPLATIRRRVQDHTKRMCYVAQLLCDHTNKIHGCEPQPDRNARAEGLRGEPPMLEAIFIALDEADQAFQALVHEAERATTLA